MPAMELAQRLVIGRGSARQKAKPQVFPARAVPVCAWCAHSARTHTNHTFTISRGWYGLCPSGVGIRVDKFLQIPTFHYIVQQKT